MNQQFTHIKYRNQQRPGSHFDLVKLEEIFQRKHLDHSPDEAHVVEFYMIMLIEAGTGQHTINFIDHQCRKGTVLTLRKGQIHRFHRGTSIKGRALLFTDEFLVSYFEESESMRSLQIFNEMLASPKLDLPGKDFQEIQDILSRISKEYHDIHDPYSLGLIRSELHILIAKLFRVKEKAQSGAFDRKYLKEFIAFQRLAEEMATKTTRVKDYAERLGVSTKTLNNISRSVANKSAKDLIDEICILQIKRLLINTELSIKEIAHASGFDESTNFYKYFKRLEGSTPEEFRALS